VSDDVEFEVEQDEGWFDNEGWRSIPNRIARDGGPDGLSWEARGMLVYLASHGRKWQTRMRDLERQGNCGRERTRRILAELIDAGYVVRTQQQERPGGPLVWRYRLRTRRASPSDGFSDSRVSRQPGEPTDGKPVHIENTDSSEHQQEEHHNPSPAPLRDADATGDDGALPGMPEPAPVEAAPADEYEAEPGFIQWWAAYPRKVDKRKALAAYRRARKRGVSIDDLARGVNRYAAERRGQDPQYTKHPTTWLNADAHANEATPASPRTSTLGPAPVGSPGKFDDMADEVYLRNPPPGFVWRDYAGPDAPNGAYVSPTYAVQLDDREDRSPR
jgi:hypothetical protein